LRVSKQFTAAFDCEHRLALAPEYTFSEVLHAHGALTSNPKGFSYDVSMKMTRAFYINERKNVNLKCAPCFCMGLISTINRNAQI